jgi:hypothetical protein
MSVDRSGYASRILDWCKQLVGPDDPEAKESHKPGVASIAIDPSSIKIIRRAKVVCEVRAMTLDGRTMFIGYELDEIEAQRLVEALREAMSDEPDSKESAQAICS